MNRSIFDNDTFFEGYRRLRDTDDNANILLEQPAMSELLPDLVGKRVLDLDVYKRQVYGGPGALSFYSRTT